MSLKMKSTPSRAPAACSSAETMARARLRKLALSRHFGAEIGEGFYRPQKPPEIVFLHGHVNVGAEIPEQDESTTCKIRQLWRFVG